MKIDKEIITFGNFGNEKHKFHHYKFPIFIKYADINNILASNKIFLVKKYKHFIGYLYHFSVKPLHIMLSETSVYV